MSYITLYERMQMFKVDIDYELEKLMSKFTDAINEFRAILHKDNFGDYPLRNHASDFSEYIHLSFDNEMKNITTKSEQYIFTAEFVVNLYEYVNRLDLSMDTMNYYSRDNRTNIRYVFSLYFERVAKVLSELGYQFAYINNQDDENYDENQISYVIVTEINPLSDKLAAAIDNPRIKFDILKFNHYKISDDEKQVLIEDMYKYFEGLRGTSVNTTANALANLMNNGLRHNSKEKIKNQAIADHINGNRSQALDEAYNLLIECYYHDLNLPIINNVKKMSQSNK